MKITLSAQEQEKVIILLLSVIGSLFLLYWDLSSPYGLDRSQYNKNIMLFIFTMLYRMTEFLFEMRNNNYRLMYSVIITKMKALVNLSTTVISSLLQVLIRMNWGVGWVLSHINPSGWFNAKSCLYILYMICKWIVCR